MADLAPIPRLGSGPGTRAEGQAPTAGSPWVFAAVGLPAPILSLIARPLEHFLAERLLQLLRLSAHLIHLGEQGFKFLGGQLRQAAEF